MSGSENDLERGQQANTLGVINGEGSPAYKLPSIVEHIREQAYDSISQYISQLFDSCDDLFYDLSSRANSNQEQALYFESMREIRIKRQGIQQSYSQEFDAHFQRLISPQHSAPAPNASNKLALVQNDELEIDVALVNMHSRANDVYSEDLYNLQVRLDHLLPGVNIDQENNPLSPELISRAFANACQNNLEISIKPLIILLKQFERFVLKRMGQVYAEANQLLIEAGIVPKIPRKLNKQANNPEGTTQEHTDENILDDMVKQQNRYGIPLARNYDGYDTHFSLSEFSELLAGARNGAFSYDNVKPYSDNPGPMMPVAELVALLNKAQTILNQQGKHETPKAYLHTVTSKLLGSRNPSKPQSLNESEDDIINLVAMFFEFILDDNHIALALRNQISRLQIPVLKLALRDNTFFSDSSHPARNLINTIAAVGVIYDDERDLKKDKIYQTIVEIVQTICHQYTFDDNIFSELLPQLEKIIDKEQHRSSIIEKRTSQTEIGKSQVKIANKTARSFLVKKLRNTRLPGYIRDFLIDRWLNVMIMALLKSQEDSEEWVTITQTVDDLIWCCQPPKDNKALQRLERLRPDTLERIGAGLKSLGEHDDTIQEELALLEDAIEKANNNQLEITMISESEEQTIVNPPTLEDSGENNDKTAIEKQQDEFSELSYEALKKAESIRPGDWIHYQGATPEKIIKCKLSTKIKTTDHYLFVNRFGLKVLEKSRRQFAYDLHQGKASLIDNTPFFERVLDRMFVNMKQAASPA